MDGVKGGTVTFSIRVTKETRDWLDKLAVARNLSRQDLILGACKRAYTNDPIQGTWDDRRRWWHPQWDRRKTISLWERQTDTENNS